MNDPKTATPNIKEQKQGLIHSVTLNYTQNCGNQNSIVLAKV